MTVETNFVYTLVETNFVYTKFIYTNSPPIKQQSEDVLAHLLQPLQLG